MAAAPVPRCCHHLGNPKNPLLSWTNPLDTALNRLNHTHGHNLEKSGRQEQVEHQEKFVFIPNKTIKRIPELKDPHLQGCSAHAGVRAGNHSTTWECGISLDWDVPELKELTKHQVLSLLPGSAPEPEEKQE